MYQNRWKKIGSPAQENQFSSWPIGGRTTHYPNVYKSRWSYRHQFEMRRFAEVMTAAMTVSSMSRPIKTLFRLLTRRAASQRGALPEPQLYHPPLPNVEA
ncbi:Hypothetical protein NTJ_01639 [Nesidiocoris tenuis]|uniref:Uncharacterized protein n=1 Tax=Nesidiocoris tenuis TaxID=355587 RepID=A0ABN7AC57_9HEMI|nr:Hypothetical protein NTJ_01639 [Nesidiocoris tenuis]